MVGRTGDHRISEPSTVLQNPRRLRLLTCKEISVRNGDPTWKSLAFITKSVKELPKTFTCSNEEARHETAAIPSLPFMEY